MMGIDPGTLTSVATIAGSVAAGLAARRVIGRLDQQRGNRAGGRREPEPAPVSAAPRPLVRPAAPMAARR